MLGVVGPLLGAIGIALAVFGFRLRSDAEPIPKHWVRATGTVVDAADPQRIEYLTPDRRRVELRAPLDTARRPGDQVALRVDPVDPSHALVVSDGTAASDTGRLLLLTGAAVLLLAIVLTIGFS